MLLEEDIMNDVFFYVVFGAAVLTSVALFKMGNVENLLNRLIYHKEFNKPIGIKKPIRLTFPDRSGVYTISEISILGKAPETGELLYGIKTHEAPNEFWRYSESQLKVKTPLYDLAMDRDIVVQVVPENYEKKVNDKISALNVELKAERDMREKYAGYLQNIIAERNKIEKEIRKGRQSFEFGYSPYVHRLFGGRTYGYSTPEVIPEPIEEEGIE